MTYTFSMGTIVFFIPKNMDINIKNVTLAVLEPKLWSNMWFRWRPLWMCHKTRLRGRKNWTPMFLTYLTPKEAIKTIKSILATEMANMIYRTRLLNLLDMRWPSLKMLGWTAANLLDKPVFFVGNYTDLLVMLIDKAIPLMDIDM